MTEEVTCATHRSLDGTSIAAFDPGHVRRLTSRVVMLAVDTTVPVRDAVSDVVRRAGGDSGLLKAVASEVLVHVTRQPGEAAERALAITVVAVDTAASLADRVTRSHAGYAVAS